MKKVILVMALAVFFCWSLTIVVAELSAPGSDGSDAVVAQLAQKTFGEYEVGSQRKLASWYGLNLTSVYQDPGFRDAYWEILDLGGHAMGYISIPSKAVSMPIYHGADTAGEGAGHLQQTAFPLGEKDTHSAMQIDLALEEGEYFYLHLLQETKAYQVETVGLYDVKDISFDPQKGEALCSLLMPLGDKVMVMQGAYAPAAPAEEEIQVRPEESSDAFLVAACMVLALGILLVPWLVWWWK